MDNIQPISELKGANGKIIVYEDKVIISRKTAMGYLIQGAMEDKTFYYKDLTNVEFRKPTIWANGYIKFIVAGTREVDHITSFFSMQTSEEAARDTNALIVRAFRKKVVIESEKIYNLIMEKLEEHKNSHKSNNTNFSIANEILKFKELLDNGIITKDEFEKKKQELLNK